MSGRMSTGTTLVDLDQVKAELKEAVELPVKNPEAFEKIGIRPVKGILLVERQAQERRFSRRP